MDGDKGAGRDRRAFFAAAAVLLAVYEVFSLGAGGMHRRPPASAAPVAAASDPASGGRTRAAALALSDRVPVDTPVYRGSVSLSGGRIDDLVLKGYRTRLTPGAPSVEMFRPDGAAGAFLAEFGWTGAPGVPEGTARWAQVAGTVLGPGRPVTLRFDGGAGLVFERELAVDEHVMFTVTDRVTNRTGSEVRLRPFGRVRREGRPVLTPNILVHEGGVGVVGDALRLRLQAYKDWAPDPDGTTATTGGWAGLTDKYWLAAVIPSPGRRSREGFRAVEVGGRVDYVAGYEGASLAVAPGRTVSETRHLYAGAKTVAQLQSYQRELDIPRFDDAVDWGRLSFLTRPVFGLLAFFHGLTGNWGVSILLMTLVVKAILFPLAYRSALSAERMRQVQPQLEAVRRTWPDDPARQQQETLQVYRTEKINPMAGCLPILAQIPVFYALSKVLWVSSEMRQAPFFGWIRDLSSPDPTSLANLFGLLPWNPAATPLVGPVLGGLLHIGAWPLIYGLTQWMSTAMTAQALADPTQRRIQQLMPLVFTVMMAQTPAGLLIYWAWSGAITVVQQHLILRSLGGRSPIDGAIDRAAEVVRAALPVQLRRR